MAKHIYIHLGPKKITTKDKKPCACHSQRAAKDRAAYDEEFKKGDIARPNYAGAKEVEVQEQNGSTVSCYNGERYHASKLVLVRKASRDVDIEDPDMSTKDESPDAMRREYEGLNKAAQELESKIKEGGPDTEKNKTELGRIMGRKENIKKALGQDCMMNAKDDGYQAAKDALNPDDRNKLDSLEKELDKLEAEIDRKDDQGVTVLPRERQRCAELSRQIHQLLQKDK